MDKQCDYLFEDIDLEGFLLNIVLKRWILEQLFDLIILGLVFFNFFLIKQGYSYDFVYVLLVDGWFEEVVEWILRDRFVDWLSGQLVF